MSLSTYQLWTDFTHCSGVSFVDFEQVNGGWECLLRVIFVIYYAMKFACL